MEILNRSSSAASIPLVAEVEEILNAVRSKRRLLEMEIAWIELADLRKLAPVLYGKRAATKIHRPRHAKRVEGAVDGGDRHTKRLAELREADRQMKGIV